MENIKNRMGLKEKIGGQAFKYNKNDISVKAFVKQGLALLFSIVLGYGTIFENISPFGMAAVISFPVNLSFSSMLGSCIGYLIFNKNSFAVRYIVACICLWVIKNKLFTEKSSYTDIWFVSPLVSFLICLLSGLSYIFATEFTVIGLIKIISESVICAIISYFIKRAFFSFAKIEDSNELSDADLTCIAVCFGVIIMCIGEINILNFSPSRIISCISCMIISYLFKEAGGCVCSCICAFALYAVYGSDYPLFAVVFAGAVAGVFSPLGKISCGILFPLIYSLITFFSQVDSGYIFITEAIISAVIFMVIPKKFYDKSMIYFRRKAAKKITEKTNENYSEKLNCAAESIVKVREGMWDVSEKLKKIGNDNNKNVLFRVRSDMCNECENVNDCWDKNFAYTIGLLKNLSQIYKEKDKLEIDDLPVHFKEKCDNYREIIFHTEKLLRKNKKMLSEEMKLMEMRELMSDQMKCTSDILKDFSKRFGNFTVIDNKLSAEIKEILRVNGIITKKTECIINSAGIMTVNAKAKKVDKNIEREKIRNEIERISLRKFYMPEIQFLESGVNVIIKQKPWMRFSKGIVQLSSDNSLISGDCVREINDENGNVILIISDGMGTGGRAAIDSAMTSEYFGNLIGAGISCDSALEMVNSALLVKSASESLATVDIAKIDLFTGKIDFSKAGAAVSFVRKNGKCSVIESASLPAGILREVSFAKESVTLCKGDIIVMVTDGVTNYGTDWIIEEINAWNCSNPDKLAQKIAGIACDKSRNDRRDDITVVAGILTA